MPRPVAKQGQSGHGEDGGRALGTRTAGEQNAEIQQMAEVEEIYEGVQECRLR